MESHDQDLVEGKDTLSIRSLVNKITYHWPLFLVSLVVCFIIGYLYFRYAIPVYEVKAAIIIKDEHKGAGYSVLKELDLVENTIVQETEMELLKSKSLVGQTVHELNLYIRYIQEGRVKKSDVYDETPVNFQVLNGLPTLIDKELEITVENPGSFVVVFGDGTTIRTGLNQTQIFRQASWRIVENPVMLKPFTGEIIKVRISDPEEVTASYQSKLSVGFTNKSKAVIGLAIEDVNPQRGINFLNKLIEVYNAASVNDKNQVAKNTMAFLDERLNYLTKELSLVEKEVEEYKSSRRITDISSESQLYLQTAKEKDTQLSQVNFKLEVLDQIKQYVRNSSITEPMPATFGIDDAVLQAQLTSFNVLLSERERMLATAGPQSPLLLIKEQQIQSSRKAIEDNMSSLHKVFEASKKELEAQSSQIESSIRRMPAIEREFISIKRQQSIKEELYLFLLQKREEAGLTYASAIADSRMVDAAHSSHNPVSPKKGLVIQLSFALGLGFPFLYIYLKDILNNKIISLDDLRKLSQIPLLGEIAYKESDSNIMISEKSKSTVAEQFRAIRTNLHYIHGKKLEKGRVTMVTSSISGEGKTFFAVNLAVSLAIAGRKVILMEMDLRKPKLTRYLSIDNHLGLSQYLIGMASIQEIVRPSSVHDNMFVISSGPIPPNPSEMLIGENLDQLIDKLKQEYDDVVIDTAPIGLVADAQIISRLANASIFVIRHNYSLKSQIRNIEQLYIEKKLPGMGIVFNGVNTGGRFGYGYGHGYGYSYGYGKDYGYYDDSVSTKNSVFGKALELIRRV